MRSSKFNCTFRKKQRKTATIITIYNIKWRMAAITMSILHEVMPTSLLCVPRPEFRSKYVLYVARPKSGRDICIVCCNFISLFPRLCLFQLSGPHQRSLLLIVHFFCPLVSVPFHSVHFNFCRAELEANLIDLFLFNKICIPCVYLIAPRRTVYERRRCRHNWAIFAQNIAKKSNSEKKKKTKKFRAERRAKNENRKK